MGKRSSFARRKNDLYRTPFDPVLALSDHLPDRFRFCEPCAGDGRLIDHLRQIGGTCIEAIDINPGRGDIVQGDAMRWVHSPRLYRRADYIITNPPWTRDILHRMIHRFSWQAPTWLLFDADWIHTKQSARHLPGLRRVVSVGRVKWIEGSKYAGKDNCAWHLFDATYSGPIEFVGRAMS
jgi:hypothetical protein